MAKKFKRIKPRTQRLYFTVFCMACLGLAAFFIASQFNDNILYFYTPNQVQEKQLPDGKTFRLGGLVKAKSFHETGPSKYEFVVTDNHQELKVEYKGMLPNLFREGQGVIATGRIEKGIFQATEILAKHDENYMPREVYEQMKKQEEERK
jgi:cytochrome c-type biogenesis protein CcmE